MSASSPHGFTVVRGRGYRPSQADGRTSELHAECDAASDRVARLELMASELTEEAGQLRARAAALPPPDYGSLGERAAKLLALAEAEDARLRATGEKEAQQTGARAESETAALRGAARKDAGRVREEAEAAAVRAVEEAEARAAGLRETAQEEARRAREEAQERLREITRRCAELREEQESSQAAESDAVTGELAENTRAAEARVAGLTEHGEAVFAEARQLHAEAEEAASVRIAEAEAEGAELLAMARVRAVGIERESERVLREHEEHAERLRQHMAHVRSSLASLTGRGPQEPPEQEDRQEDRQEGWQEQLPEQQKPGGQPELRSGTGSGTGSVTLPAQPTGSGH